MANRLTWYPAAIASADPLVLDTATGSAIRLLWLDGIDPLTVGPFSTKGPGQEGETALDVTVPMRTVTAQALVDADTLADLWDQRAAIARAFVNIPVRFGEDLELGRLLFERDGKADRELAALPRAASVDFMRAPAKAMLDAEWLAPYPYMSDTADTTSDEIAVDASEVIADTGDVDAPILARIFGPATEVSLINLTSGEVFTVTVTLADDTEWLEVDTTPGRKTVRKYTDPDTWTNAIGGLDLADGRLWLLRPGNNSVKLEAVGDTGDTHAVVTHRNRYAGL